MMTPWRALAPDEQWLLEQLICGSERPIQTRTPLHKLRVKALTDGGRDGLQFRVAHTRSARWQVAAAELIDLDGQQVLVFLDVDEHSDLYALDVWKPNWARCIGRFNEMAWLGYRDGRPSGGA